MDLQKINLAQVIQSKANIEEKIATVTPHSLVEVIPKDPLLCDAIEVLSASQF